MKTLLKTFSLVSLIVVSLSSCKTVRRDDFPTSVSDVSIRLPAEFANSEARATFTSLEKNGDTRLVKGKDLNIKLPSGNYSVELVILNADGSEEYKSCNTSRPYVFSQPKENAIIDICKLSDRSIVLQTLPAGPVVDPIPPVVVPEIKDPIPVIPDPLPPTEVQAQFSVESNCFGMPVVATQIDKEIVLKMDGLIQNKVMDSLSYLRCNITVTLAKEKGKIISPLKYQINYALDDKSLKQNLWLLASGRDENTNLSLPCETYLFDTNANSKKYFTCSFYDTAPDKNKAVYSKFAAQYSASCQAETTKFVLGFTIAGPSKALITAMTIPELRFQIPTVESCL